MSKELVDGFYFVFRGLLASLDSLTTTEAPRLDERQRQETQDMKTKKNKDYYVERAKEALRTLVIYFDITRPMNSKAYKVDGKFSITVYKNQMKFLAEWKKRDPQSKKKLAALYDRVLSAYNYNQGIPHELLVEICGRYFNEDGRRVRVPLTEVVDALVADGFIRPRDKQPKGGAKFNKGDDGTYTKKCWWANKYLLANERRQYAMMGDKRYMSIETFPKPSDPVKYQGYRLARNVIFKWIKNTKMKKSTEDKNMTMDELHEEVLAEVAKTPPMEDVKIEPERVETLDELVNGWNAVVKNTPPKPSPKPIPAPTPTPTRIETPQSAPATRRELSVYQKMRLDEYVERHMSGVLTRERLYKYMNEDFGGNAEALAYVKNALKKGTTK